MKYNIVARNIELTDSLKDYINKRLEGLERYSHHIMDGEMTVEELRGRYITQFVINMKGSVITAKCERKDLYESIDGLKDKLKTQLTKYEDKLRERK